MKVLWIVNSLIPEIAVACNLKSGNSSGWLSGMLNGLQTYKNNLDIVIAFPFNGNRIEGKMRNIRYISFFESKNDKKNKQTAIDLEGIISSENPDVIHIFGTEYPHTLAAVSWAEKLGKIDYTVINIQGLISKCAEHYYAGLPVKIVHRYTLRDFIKRDNIFGQRKKFAKRGQFEIAALKKAKHVIGRTEWDKACVLQINDKLNYHTCNETLRSDFYYGTWDLDTCEPYSVFVTQCGYPLKAFHMVLKAFKDIVKKYPSARLYTTGQSVEKLSSLKNIKHRTYYTVYLKKLIYKYNLQNNITFLGDLDAKGMRERLLKSNVFVLPSSLENSSNSLGEAMILGVPNVASDVGGVKTFVQHSENGFIYPFDEPYMLTHYIDKIFSEKELAKRLSLNAQTSAKQIFDIKTNAETLFAVYTKLSNKNGTENNEK